MMPRAGLLRKLRVGLIKRSRVGPARGPRVGPLNGPKREPLNGAGTGEVKEVTTEPTRGLGTQTRAV
jgi:hypothetical protein